MTRENLLKTQILKWRAGRKVNSKWEEDQARHFLPTTSIQCPPLPNAKEEGVEAYAGVKLLTANEAYEAAGRLVQETACATEMSARIVNMRSTADKKGLQAGLYEQIVRGLKEHPNWEYTRITTFESDPHLWITRSFLEQVGTRSHFRLIYTFGCPTLPSSFIADYEAILGFLGPDGSVTHGLQITDADLVARLREMYVNLYVREDSLVMTLKGLDQEVATDKIPEVVKGVERRGQMFGKEITRSSERPKQEWISEDT